MGRLTPYLLVGLGSFIGGNARFIVARWVGGLVDGRFPLGTFLINVSGSFLLGLIGGLLADRALPHADVIRLALGSRASAEASRPSPPSSTRLTPSSRTAFGCPPSRTCSSASLPVSWRFASGGGLEVLVLDGRAP